MAYSIYDQVNNTSFQPLSFEQLIQPVQMAQQQHDLIDNQIFQLSSEADRIGAYASEQTDPLSYQMYKNYSNQLSDAANRLSTEGVNPSSTRDLLKLRNTYSSTILPIQEAITARQESSKRYADALQKDPTLITNINPGAVSLDAYLTDKNAYQYQNISGEGVRKMVSETAKPLAQRLAQTPEWRLTQDGQYFETIMQRGFSPQDIANALSDNGHPLLKSIIQSAITSSGISQWNLENNPIALNRFLNYANQGLYSAIGKDEVDTRRNIDYLNPLQRLQYAKKLGEIQQTEQGIPIRTYSEINVDNTKRKQLEAIGRNLNIYEENANGELIVESPLRSSEYTQDGFSFSQAYRQGVGAGSGANQQAYNQEINNGVQYLIDKYGNDESFGSTQAERVRRGLQFEKSLTASNLPRYTPELTSNEPINSLVRKSLLAGGQRIHKLDKNYTVGKEVKKGDRENLIEMIGKNDVDYWISPQAKGIVMADGKDNMYLLPYEAFGFEAGNQIRANLDAAQRQIMIGNLDNANRYLEEATAAISVTANTKLPIQGRSNSKL